MSAKWPTSVAADADLYVAVNSLQTTLSTALGTSDTSVVLASATGFPVAGGVTIGNEVIFYTGVSGATLTGCTRGADGTTAASHSVGVPVGAAIIAFHHNGLMAEIEAIESYLDTVLGKGTAVTATEFTYLHGVTSAIQTQMNLKAALAGPTFTGTVTIPTPFTLGAISVTATGTELNYSVGVTSAIQSQLGLKAPLAGPTFTGTVTVPTPFTVGAVSVTATGTELNFTAGVTSAIQTQLNLKAPLASPTFTGSAVAATLDVQTLLKGKGTATNDNAAAGYIGEYDTVTASSVAAPTNGQFKDAASTTLAAGDYEITVAGIIVTQAAVAGDFVVGFSTTTGNSGTGLVYGASKVAASYPATSSYDVPFCITGRLLLSTSSTVYFKYLADYASGTGPQITGSLSWRRVR